MNREEFLDDVRDNVVDYVEFCNDYSTFNKYQELAKETLYEFHKVCEKNNVNYQVAFGSLLGAIRDGGQIPWDYDIDVMVPATERKKLIDALKKDLDPKFYFYCIELNKNCRHVIMRLAPKGFDTLYLHVDVFFVMGLPNDSVQASRMKKRIYDLSLIYKAKHFSFSRKELISKRELFRMVFFKIKGIFLTRKKVIDEYTNISQLYSLEKSEKCCLADRFANWYEFPTEMFNNTILFTLNDGMAVRIPKNYDLLLKIQYGDYASVPNIEDRIKEVQEHLKYLKLNCPIE